MSAERTTMTCPHCDGTGKGPQSGYWGAVLTASGHLPAECQNCLGAGVIVVAPLEQHQSPQEG